MLTLRDFIYVDIFIEIQSYKNYSGYSGFPKILNTISRKIRLKRNSCFVLPENTKNLVFKNFVHHFCKMTKLKKC